MNPNLKILAGMLRGGVGPKHFPLANLRWANNQYSAWLEGSHTLLSMGLAPRTALIFVHGWAGSAGDTWEAFPRYVRLLEDGSNVDVFLLNYPSKDDPVEFCAAVFRIFLIDLLRRPSKSVINPSLPITSEPRDENFTYSNFRLIGHSMGTVVIRRALLSLELDKELTDSERDCIRMLFFAPAHKGSRLPLMIASGMGLDWLPGSKTVGMALELYYRSLHDLKEGSATLTKLEDDSKTVRIERMERNSSVDCLRAYVYHAQGDRVVLLGSFDRDHAIVPIMQTNHRAICKPNKQYTQPVEALRLIL